MSQGVRYLYRDYFVFNQTNLYFSVFLKSYYIKLQKWKCKLFVRFSYDNLRHNYNICK